MAHSSAFVPWTPCSLGTCSHSLCCISRSSCRPRLCAAQAARHLCFHNPRQLLWCSLHSATQPWRLPCRCYTEPQTDIHPLSPSVGGFHSILSSLEHAGTQDPHLRHQQKSIHHCDRFSTMAARCSSRREERRQEKQVLPISFNERKG